MAAGTTQIGGASPAYLAYLQQQIGLLAQSVQSVSQFTRYVFTQSTASSTWNIPHNLNTRPTPMIVDNSGHQVICEVTYPDLNNMTLKFTPALAGTCYYI